MSEPKIVVMDPKQCTTDERKDLLDFVLATYANEPCRICRLFITQDETRDSVFTGYTDVDGKVSRASHGACWRAMSEEQRTELKARVDAEEGAR